MTWLEKMDAVLLCLDKLSGDNPRFPDLEKWLSENYPDKIDKGELQDITLYLWIEQMMYFESNGLRTSDYNDNLPDGRYLISCKGKMFMEGVGGFIKKDKRDSNAASLQFWQTWAIVVGTFLAGLYGLVEILKYISRLFSCGTP